MIYVVIEENLNNVTSFTRSNPDAGVKIQKYGEMK
jgi:hypothetical protein